MATGNLWDFITGKKSDEAPGKPDTSASDSAASRTDLSSLKGTAKGNVPAGSGSRKSSKAQQTIEQIQLAETLEKLYDPKNFKPIGKLYFNARYGITGFEHFLLTPAEEETIAASLAMVTEALWLWDPRLLAVIIAGGNIGSIVAAKEIAYAQHVKAIKAQAKV
jgi:hypothetical protein